MHERREEFCDCYAVVDCKGLWHSLTSPQVGSLLDVSMVVYLLAAREAFATGLLKHVVWVPTDDMLSDGLTKNMEDRLWARLYATGRWDPSEAHVCTRTGSDGRRTRVLKAFLEFWLGEERSGFAEEHFDEEIAFFCGFALRAAAASW